MCRMFCYSSAIVPLKKAQRLFLCVSCFNESQCVAARAPDQDRKTGLNQKKTDSWNAVRMSVLVQHFGFCA